MAESEGEGGGCGGCIATLVILALVNLVWFGGHWIYHREDHRNLDAIVKVLDAERPQIEAQLSTITEADLAIDTLDGRILFLKVIMSDDNSNAHLQAEKKWIDWMLAHGQKGLNKSGLGIETDIRGTSEEQRKADLATWEVDRQRLADLLDKAKNSLEPRLGEYNRKVSEANEIQRKIGDESFILPKPVAEGLEIAELIDKANKGELKSGEINDKIAEKIREQSLESIIEGNRH
jgi:hypothetical protein